MTGALLSVPTFPLPRVVLFPGARLPLHIFEPRYRAMVRDALAGRGEIAMALLKQGYEGQYRGSPPVHDVGCIGSMENVHPLPDGRFLLELIGLSRVRFVEWEQIRPYRVARCRLLPEKVPEPDSPEAREKILQLAATFQTLIQQLAGGDGPLTLEADLAFAKTVNRICFALDIDPEEKQRLLLEDDLLDRARRVGEHLDRVLTDVSGRSEAKDIGSIN